MQIALIRLGFQKYTMHGHDLLTTAETLLPAWLCQVLGLELDTLIRAGPGDTWLA